MSREAGVERNGQGLAAALREVEALARVHGEAPTLTTARLILQGALDREESRGAHYRTDFPNLAPVARHSRQVARVATPEQQGTPC